VLFADVPAALQAWSARSRVAIYSSGSVEAQQLFFRHSIYGDLTPLISGYFDTHTGPKSEIASYVAIAAAMQVSTQETIFFSDAVAELDAARKADCHTRLVVRQGNARINYEHFHERIGSLEKISNDVSRDETTEVAPGNESLD
jgi:enolase-phosphatase E1